VESDAAANKFGQFIVANLWDESIEFFDGLAQGRWKATALQNLQEELTALPSGQQDIVRRCVIRTLQTGLHQLLFAISEAADSKSGISIIVDGVNVADQSDGLHGEPYGPDGWMAKYAKHPEGYPTYGD
jgi:hypothetical protein